MSSERPELLETTKRPWETPTIQDWQIAEITKSGSSGNGGDLGSYS